MSVFIELVRGNMRLRGYSLGTEKTYLLWIKGFIYFCEVQLILNQLVDRNRLIIELLYGSGIRLKECLSIRLQDIDIDRASLVVGNGKGRKDRQILLGLSSIARLEVQYQKAIVIHKKDAYLGISAKINPALQRKYPTGVRKFLRVATLAAGSGIRTVQELLGHNDVTTTQIYTHVSSRHYWWASSSLDELT